MLAIRNENKKFDYRKVYSDPKIKKGTQPARRSLQKNDKQPHE